MSEKNGSPNLERPIVRFLCLLGGADTSVLNECPGERFKFYQIALPMINTSIMAGLTMYFCIRSIFPNELIFNSAIFAFFWAFIILTIDWGLVRSLQPDVRFARHPIRQTLRFQVLFRVLIAAAIALSIAQPLEVALFHDLIELQLGSKKINYLKSGVGNLEQLYLQRTDSMLTMLHRDRQRVDSLRRNTDQKPKYKQLKEELKLSKLKYDIARRRFDSVSARNNNEIKFLKRDFKNYEITKREDGTVDSTLIKSVKNRISALKLQNGILKGEKVTAEKDTVVCKQNLQDYEVSEDENLNDIEEGIQTLVDSVSHEGILAKARVESNKIDLERRADEGFAGSLMARINALWALHGSEYGQWVWISTFLIWFLLFLVDTSPIGMKLFTNFTVYEQKKKLLEIEEQIKDELRVSLAQTQLDLSLKLSKSIRTIQEDLTKEAVEEFRKNESQNMPSNYKKYVSNGE